MTSVFKIKITILLSILTLLFIDSLGTLLSFPIGFLLIFTCSAYLPSFFGSFWAPTPTASIIALVREVKALKGKSFYDLGSGDARIVAEIAKKTGSKATGVEIDFLKCLFSNVKLKLFGIKNAKIRRGSFFTTDLSDADIIFCYLPRKTIEKLEYRIKRLKKGTVIISYYIEFKGLKLTKHLNKEKIYIYRL